MDFFAHQDEARRNTKRLVGYYVLAVALIVFAVYAACVLIFQLKGEADRPVPYWDPLLFGWVAALTLAVIVGGTLYKIAALSRGGEHIARMLGGREVAVSTTDGDERRLLNVIEEMAIASGTAVPRVFVLDEEEGINAFAAGFTAADAVVGVTRGCLQSLTRDELQGVIAHEFSHILNGDMRLNLRLMGVLHGILVISLIGYWTLRATLRSGSGRRSSRDRKQGNALPFVLMGLALMAIGWIGVFFGRLIKSAVSRQREFLADAASAQFTRNPGALAGALRKIGAASGRLASPRAEEASHLFFAEGLRQPFLALMATHPPLEQRIRRLDPSFDGELGAPPAPLSPQAPAPSDEDDFLPAMLNLGGAPLSDRVGAPGAAQLAFASRVVSSLPRSMAAMSRTPTGARAAVYALLLSREPETLDAQLRAIRAAEPGEVTAAVEELYPIALLQPASHRIPLLDLALPALRGLTPAEYAAFRRLVEQLVLTDSHISLFEYALHRILIRHLDPHFSGPRPRPVRYTSPRDVAGPIGIVLATLAAAGARDPDAPQHAFAAGVELAGAGSLEMPALPEASFAALDAALETLAEAAPQVRKNVLAAAAAVIGADGAVCAEEAELLRAVADSLDCPLPPLVAPPAVPAA